MKSKHSYPVHMRARDLWNICNTFLFQHDGTCTLRLDHHANGTYTVTLFGPYDLSTTPNSVVPGWLQQYGARLDVEPNGTKGFRNTFTFK